MEQTYLWLKALHVIFFISWMAGMLYLPRIFVYHTKAEKGGEADKAFQVMERKLLRYIMNPAMIGTFAFGIALYFVTGLNQPGAPKWIHAKFGLALLLAACHGMMAKYRKDFVAGNNAKDEKFYRFFNEIPTILMIMIVLLAILKPF